MTGSAAPPGSGENTLTVSQSSGSAPGATGADGGLGERYAAEDGHAVLHPPAYLPGGRTDHGLGYIHPHPFSGDEPETSGCGPPWPPGRTLSHRVEQDDWNFAR